MRLPIIYFECMGSSRKLKGEKPNDPVMQQLGMRIKALRVKRNVNYEHFAYEHNFSRAQISRYENGEDIRFSTLVRLVKALDVSLSDFFSEGFENAVK